MTPLRDPQFEVCISRLWPVTQSSKHQSSPIASCTRLGARYFACGHFPAEAVRCTICEKETWNWCWVWSSNLKLPSESKIWCGHWQCRISWFGVVWHSFDSSRQSTIVWLSSKILIKIHVRGRDKNTQSNDVVSRKHAIAWTEQDSQQPAVIVRKQSWQTVNNSICWLDRADHGWSCAVAAYLELVTMMTHVKLNLSEEPMIHSKTLRRVT